MGRLSFATVVAILCGSLIVCFSGPAPAQTPKPTPTASKASSKGAPSPGSKDSQKSPSAASPVRGGILRGVRGQFPKDMSYAPEWSPTDSMFALPFGERLVDWDESGNLVPQLATSWEGDPKDKDGDLAPEKGCHVP